MNMHLAQVSVCVSYDDLSRLSCVYSPAYELVIMYRHMRDYVKAKLEIFQNF